MRICVNTTNCCILMLYYTIYCAISLPVDYLWTNDIVARAILSQPNACADPIYLRESFLVFAIHSPHQLKTFVGSLHCTDHSVLLLFPDDCRAVKMPFLALLRHQFSQKRFYHSLGTEIHLHFSEIAPPKKS